MKGRNPTAQERRHMALMAEGGCVVCRKHLSVFSPAEIHHPQGKTTPDAHMKAIPLCSRHHRIPSNTGDWVSRHGDGKKAFEAAYGTEESLLHWVTEGAASDGV